MKLRLRCASVLAALLAVLPASAYYHFNSYINGLAAPQKFDLNALPGKTVTFFVSGSGPAQFSATDTFGSVLSQIRQAAAAWNNVSTSDLRVAFGGLENVATLQNAAGGDVVFEDLPPGVYGFGGPTATLSPVFSEGGPFVPVTRSVVHLNRNLTALPGPSYNETFFLTVVHEMGHALGLQHTFTSSAMSTATTRATTLSRPIDADDIAGISLLYPNPGFAQFGSIAGRITAAGQGVHLASVVAIRAGSGAISAMTAPDGTYRIAGVPAGQYFVYVHSVPLDADIRGPWNSDGSTVAASGPISASFYPGSTSLQQAAPVSVQAGAVRDGVNIAVGNRSSIPIYNVGVYGYFGNNPVGVKPAYVNMLAAPSGAPGATVVASGTGLGSNGQAAGLNAQFLGGSAYLWPNGVRPYQAGGFTYIALDVGFAFGAQTGPQHIVFTTPDYMHVLPSGMNLTQKAPPTVASVAGNGDGTVTVAGTNWAPDSQIYFDGLPAAVSSLDPRAGLAVVTPPAGANGQTATVSVFNADGQNSQFVQSASPVRFGYGPSATPTVVGISPSSLPAATEATVEIVGSGFNFLAGQVIVGFGSSDIVVRRVFVAGPNRLLVNVSVSGGAALSNPDVSVISGFQIAVAPAGFQITPQLTGQPSVIPILQNLTAGLTGVWPGASIAINGSGFTAAGAGTTVTLNGQPVRVFAASPAQLSVQIPQSATPGLSSLVVNNGQSSSFPVTVDIDNLPASVLAITNSAGALVESGRVAHAGDLLTVTLGDFGPAGAAIAASRVQVLAGGVIAAPLQVIPGSAAGTWQVSFLIQARAAIGPAQQVIVYLDGRSSYPAFIPIARADGSFNVTDGTDGN